MTTITTTLAEPQPSAISTLIAIFTEPAKAFQSVQKRSMVWLPLALLIAFSSVLIVWYYQTVDISWMQDKLTAGFSDPALREKSKEFMSRSRMQNFGIAGIVIGLPVMYALIAVYFLIVAKIKKLEIGFGKWFSFVVWASVPALLSLPLGALQILLAHNGQLDPSQLNPVSLNSLFFHIGTGQKWASLLDSISLITIWSWVLFIVGYQTWTKSTRVSSIVVVLLPYAVIFGIWAVISFLSKSV